MDGFKDCQSFVINLRVRAKATTDRLLPWFCCLCWVLQMHKWGVHAWDGAVTKNTLSVLPV